MVRKVVFTNNDEEVEYRFRYCLDEIPWAKTSTVYTVEDFDEEREGLTEWQKALWQKYSGKDISSLEDFTIDEAEFLGEISMECAVACDDDSDLLEYWPVIKEQAIDLGLPIFRIHRHQDILETLQEYILTIEKTGFQSEGVSDLLLSTIVCCCLEKWGWYECSWEL